MDIEQIRRRLVLGAAVFGLLGVALGAFGTHALSARLDPGTLGTFEVAVRYQLIHAVVLLALAGIVDWSPRLVGRAGWLITAGIVIFAGSLYALVFTGIGRFGAVTPFGGLCFLAGWTTIAWAAWGKTGDTSGS